MIVVNSLIFVYYSFISKDIIPARSSFNQWCSLLQHWYLFTLFLTYRLLLRSFLGELEYLYVLFYDAALRTLFPIAFENFNVKCLRVDLAELNMTGGFSLPGYLHLSTVGEFSAISPLGKLSTPLEFLSCNYIKII